MTTFVSHTPESAPDGAKETLAALEKRYGFQPDLYARLAESPQALDAYLALSERFEKSSLGPLEQQTVLLAASVENRCEFCVGAHSFIARHLAKVPSPVVDALRAGDTLPDARLDALARFTREVVRQRGWVNETELEAFLAAGFTRQNVLDVVLGVTQKTLSNYANHLVGTELNEQFAAEAWTAPEHEVA